MAIKTPKKIVTFIATQYGNEPVQVNFYTKNGERVEFTATEKVSTKTQIKFKSRK